MEMSPSVTSWTLPTIPVTGEPAFDHFFSLVFFFGAFSWYLGALLSVFRGR